MFQITMFEISTQKIISKEFIGKIFYINKDYKVLISLSQERKMSRWVKNKTLINDYYYYGEIPQYFL